MHRVPGHRVDHEYPATGRHLFAVKPVLQGQSAEGVILARFGRADDGIPPKELDNNRPPLPSSGIKY